MVLSSIDVKRALATLLLGLTCATSATLAATRVSDESAQAANRERAWWPGPDVLLPQRREFRSPRQRRATGIRSRAYSWGLSACYHFNAYVGTGGESLRFTGDDERGGPSSPAPGATALPSALSAAT